MVTLRGSNFPSSGPSTVHLVLDGAAPIVVDTRFVSSNELQFVTPALPVTVSTYLSVELYAPDRVKTVPPPFPAMLFVFVPSGSSQFQVCPDGSSCPGGGRMWPGEGFWSRSEVHAPIACDVEHACVGSLGTEDGYPVAFHASGARVTSLCREGYAGRACASCAPGYAPLAGTCLATCNSKRSDLIEFVILCFVFVSLVVGGSVGVAVAKRSVRVAQGASVVGAIQVLVLAARLCLRYASPFAPEWMVHVARVLSLVLLDADALKAECIVGSMSFLSRYWIMVGAVEVLGLALAVSVWVRGLRTPKGAVLDEASGDPVGIRGRGGVAVLVLLCVSFIPVVSMTMQGLACESEPHASGDGNGLFLKVEPSTECFSGSHLLALPGLVLMGLVFLLGLPCTSLGRTRVRRGLRVGMRSGLGWVRVVQLWSVVLCLGVVVFALGDGQSETKLFVIGCGLVVSLVCVGVFRPYAGTWLNVLHVAVFAVSSALIGWAMDGQGWEWVVLLAMFGVCALLLLFVFVFRCSRVREDKDADASERGDMDTDASERGDMDTDVSERGDMKMTLQDSHHDDSHHDLHGNSEYDSHHTSHHNSEFDSQGQESSILSRDVPRDDDDVGWGDEPCDDRNEWSLDDNDDVPVRDLVSRRSSQLSSQRSSQRSSRRSSQRSSQLSSQRSSRLSSQRSGGSQPGSLSSMMEDLMDVVPDAAPETMSSPVKQPHLQSTPPPSHSRPSHSRPQRPPPTPPLTPPPPPNPLEEVLLTLGVETRLSEKEVADSLRWMSLSGIKTLGDLKMWSPGELVQIGVASPLASLLDKSEYLTKSLMSSHKPRHWASMGMDKAQKVHEAEQQRRAAVLLGARRFRMSLRTSHKP